MDERLRYGRMSTSVMDLRMENVQYDGLTLDVHLASIQGQPIAKVHGWLSTTE